jgi:NAD(P)-dependent dehydrogenase (short-subunit alcohol dehydrogenase family)
MSGHEKDAIDHRQQNRPVVLITGTSSGIGRACAEALATSGYRVFGTQRRPREGSAAFETLIVDVDDAASVSRAVATVVDKAGRIDAVINNAGNAWMGAVEETSIDEARAQLETNFFGVLRVVHAVVPIMRRQGGGRIINISSLAGVLGMPFSGLYSASKFALEGMTESLRRETRHFGIHVSLVEPGDFDTGLPAARRMTAQSQSSDVYRDFFAAIKTAQDRDEAMAPKPVAVAELVRRILRARRPKLRYGVGRLGQRIVIPLKRFLPQSWFEWLLGKALALPPARRPLAPAIP